jgi:hypothetical protein
MADRRGLADLAFLEKTNPTTDSGFEVKTGAESRSRDVVRSEFEE